MDMNYNIPFMNDGLAWLIVIVFFIFIIFIPLGVVHGIKNNKLYKVMQLAMLNYKQIEANMSERHMLALMGNHYEFPYNRSILANGRTQYVWVYNDYSPSYQRVSKVTIICKDGKVLEVRPYNMP